jgi:hypothetical protein
MTDGEPVCKECILHSEEYVELKQAAAELNCASVHSMSMLLHEFKDAIIAFEARIRDNRRMESEEK